jgi:hypothetical protein
MVTRVVPTPNPVGVLLQAGPRIGEVGPCRSRTRRLRKPFAFSSSRVIFADFLVGGRAAPASAASVASGPGWVAAPAVAYSPPAREAAAPAWRAAACRAVMNVSNPTTAMRVNLGNRRLGIMRSCTSSQKSAAGR